MKLSQAGELVLLEMLRNRFGTRTEGLILGIGDDAAVMRSRGNLLLTTDMVTEGVHFNLRWTTPFQLGFKLVSVNVSDIYAMGGRPRFLLVNFAAPGSSTTQFFRSFFDGVERALKTYKVSLIGGDISASDKVVLSATAVGTASRFIGRKGAMVGDRIYVTGSLGDSAAGLELLKLTARKVEIEKGRRGRFPIPWRDALPLIERHLMPCAREPFRFVKQATSMIDVSDGLMIDLARLCRESGVGAKIHAQAVPVSGPLEKAARHFGRSVLSFALSGGEDYELLFTARPGKKIKAVCIGEITRRGMVCIDESGKQLDISRRGYEHFSIEG
jgi:thiamine-monophosphate kinase